MQSFHVSSVMDCSWIRVALWLCIVRWIFVATEFRCDTIMFNYNVNAWNVIIGITYILFMPLWRMTTGTPVPDQLALCKWLFCPNCSDPHTDTEWYLSLLKLVWMWCCLRAVDRNAPCGLGHCAAGNVGAWRLRFSTWSRFHRIITFCSDTFGFVWCWYLLVLWYLWCCEGNYEHVRVHDMRHAYNVNFYIIVNCQHNHVEQDFERQRVLFLKVCTICIVYHMNHGVIVCWTTRFYSL